MKLRLKTEEFTELLTTVLPAVSGKTTLPTLSHFLIEAEKNRVKVYATDLEIGIESSIKTEVEKEGACTVPARSLTDMVKALDSEYITFKKITESQYELSDGNTTFRLMGGEKEEFPVLPSVKEEETADIEASKLKEGVEKTIFSVSRDESRYVLCGIYFNINTDSLEMVSTDGRRLSYFKEALTEENGSFNAIVPTKAINVLDRALPGSDDKVKICVSASESQIYFSFADTILYSRIIDGDYPNYSQVIPDKPTKSIIADTKTLLDATRRMMAVTPEKFVAVKYRFADNTAVLSINAPETGSGTSNAKVEYNGEEIEIAFNPDFIINAMKVIKSEKVVLGLTTPINPGKITPVSDTEKYIGVVMPMRP